MVIPRVAYGRLINARKDLGSAVLERIRCLPVERQSSAGRAYDVFAEYHARLHFRFLDLLAAEAEVAWMEAPPPGYTLEEAQMRFVDDFESFHQHIYATLAALAHLLVRLVPAGRNVPTGSIKKFIDYLALGLPERTEDLATLEASRAYRAKYVDHPQQSAVQNWFTYRLPAPPEVFLIYFEHATETVEVLAASGLHPRDPSFQPPVRATSWLVAPGARETYAAILNVSKCALCGLLWQGDAAK